MSSEQARRLLARQSPDVPTSLTRVHALSVAQPPVPQRPAPSPQRPALVQRLLRVAPPQVFLVLMMTAVVSVVIFGVSEMTAGRIQETRTEVATVRKALGVLEVVRAGL